MLIATAVSVSYVSLSHQYLPVCPNLSRSIRVFSHTLAVSLGRAEGVGQVGNRAHDATIGRYLSDTGKERAQDHAGRAWGHLFMTVIVSWSTMSGAVMIDGYPHHTGHWFPTVLEYRPVNAGLLLPSVRRLYPCVGRRSKIPGLRYDWSYVMVRNRAGVILCDLDNQILIPGMPHALRHSLAPRIIGACI